MDGLHQLCFLLTADPEKAEQCFLSGLEDCVKANNVFKEWARSWAKRNIIQQAIRIVQPRADHAVSSVSAMVSREIGLITVRDEHIEVNRVLALDQFERFVFVMSVLEHYSEHDCVLLLGCSVQDIRRARVRAIEQLAHSYCMSSDSDSVAELQGANR